MYVTLLQKSAVTVFNSKLFKTSLSLKPVIKILEMGLFMSYHYHKIIINTVMVIVLLFFFKCNQTLISSDYFSY